MPLWTVVLDQVPYVLDFGSDFSYFQIHHLVMLSAIVPEIFGNNEMDDELTGELGIDK